MRLAAKGVSCNTTLETMISLTFRRVYVEEKGSIEKNQIEITV
jgi:hypothetical protein